MSWGARWIAEKNVSSIPTARDSFHVFVGHLLRWTVRASVAYVAVVAAAVWAWRLDPAWVTAAAIGVIAGAAGLWVRVRVLLRTARGRAAFAPLSVLGQLAVLGVGLAAAMIAAPAGFLAAAGGVVLGNVMIVVVGLRSAARET